MTYYEIYILHNYHAQFFKYPIFEECHAVTWLWYRSVCYSHSRYFKNLLLPFNYSCELPSSQVKKKRPLCQLLLCQIRAGNEPWAYAAKSSVASYQTSNTWYSCSLALLFLVLTLCIFRYAERYKGRIICQLLAISGVQLLL